MRQRIQNVGSALVIVVRLGCFRIDQVLNSCLTCGHFRNSFISDLFKKMYFDTLYLFQFDYYIIILRFTNSLINYIFQVDGDFTLNENVCDIDGLNLASSAFQGLREMSANDLIHLPNNPYTPQQLFFINTAQVSFIHWLLLLLLSAF